MNESGLTPVGPRVLVKLDKIEEVTEGGIVLPQQVRDKETVAAATGTVVALGPEAFTDWETDWAREGDHVLFSKHAGLFVMGQDEEEYRVLWDKDIVTHAAEGVRR